MSDKADVRFGRIICAGREAENIARKQKPFGELLDGMSGLMKSYRAMETVFIMGPVTSEAQRVKKLREAAIQLAAVALQFSVDIVHE